MKRLIKIVAVCVAVPICALAIWFVTLLWSSPDYAATSSCPLADIDRTNSALEREHDFGKAVHMRLWHERATFHQNSRTLESNFQWLANRIAFSSWDRRNTIAFYCDHAYVRLGSERPVTYLPLAASRLRPEASSDDEAWDLAICLSHSSFSSDFPDGYPTVSRLRDVCKIRKANRIKRGE
ncbi:MULTISPECIES: hypothetical protein [Asticcacaulis]|uniref:hypothetical protein n=1 Tax=Asticcacaulis TaxID=76890 RepID=UPI001AE83EEB|nr:MULTISPECIES: hypothetical protein [Asticcacaulis]MBP2158032.1 hypothetical protein [Asticcacaulis solisilvae]MDR6799077.1 hypothetical protein [Asticcacaulis sp. BE141]